MPRRQPAIRDTAFDERLPLRVVRMREQGAGRIHAHRFSELVLVHRGSALHVLGEDAWPIRRGDVFVIAGAQRHGYRDTRRLRISNLLFEPLERWLPVFDLADLPGYQALFGVEPARRFAAGARVRLGEAAMRRSESQVDAIERELRGRGPGWRAAAAQQWLALVTRLARAYDQHQPGADDLDAHMAELLSWCECHCCEPIAASSLQARSGMSPSTLLRSFKRAVGMSPTDYILAARLRRACQLMRASTRSITDIALSCGFNDSNYFARCFRSRFQMSPSAYRRLPG